jgi:hypothetical protein
MNRKENETRKMFLNERRHPILGSVNVQPWYLLVPRMRCSEVGGVMEGDEGIRDLETSSGLQALITGPD